MKANRSANLRRQENDRAEIGIGTLIVFIAAVLVAAVAAAVLINTSGQLQQRSEETGQAATRDVSSSMRLMGIWASRAGTTGNMDHLNITIGTSGASDKVDLSNTTIIIQSTSTRSTLAYTTGAPSSSAFNATEVRDSDGSYSVATPVMSAGDLVTVWIDLGSANGTNMALSPGDELNIRFLPPVGAPLVSDVTMPQTFGTSTVLQVR